MQCNVRVQSKNGVGRCKPKERLAINCKRVPIYHRLFCNAVTLSCTVLKLERK
jgi:hypothetical protein